MSKYVFVTGGVTSSLGKGIISSSLGMLLKQRGYSVTIQKFDPYINVDSGTMNPYEHGECFVTEDGSETDLDLGHYERFMDISTSKMNNVTTGKIYKSVIEKERKGEYLGKTVQVIPHITDEIKQTIFSISKGKDIVIVEIGGTIGDIESYPYIEAARQICWEFDNDSIVIHLTLIPYLEATKELKTKPTQNSVKMLMESGLKADILVCRSSYVLTESVKNKIALFCNVKNDSVIEALDTPIIYDIPIMLYDQNFDKLVLNYLNLDNISSPNLDKWNGFLDNYKNPNISLKIGLIGKYVSLEDSYKSIIESFMHAGAKNKAKIDIVFVDSTYINEDDVCDKLNGLDGILVAPGFGKRGVSGKILACKYARENKVPFLGICLGMQLAVIEFCRNVLNIKEADSSEMNENTKYPVITLMESQKLNKLKGASMRLGSWDCDLKPNTLAYHIYKSTNRVKERHRHRWEINLEYLDALNEKGMIFSGINPDTKLVEIIEIKNHPWFLGVQFHPEYRSRVINPHPLFDSFVKALIDKKIKKK